MKFWRHFWHLVFVFPGFISFCFERLRQELFFLSSEGTLFDDYLYVPLQRTINRWNGGFGGVGGLGPGDKDQDCFDTADDCLPPLIPPQSFAAAKLCRLLKKRHWNGNRRLRACVRVSVRARMKYSTCNANIFFWAASQKFLCKRFFFHLQTKMGPLKDQIYTLKLAAVQLTLL